MKQQALFETERKWKDKHEKEQYSLTIHPVESSKIFPMLASTYSGKDIFPCYIQPKLDGLRCIMYKEKDKIVAQSRAGNTFDLPFLTESFRSLFMSYPELVLDGELYTNEIPFETLAGLIKKQRSENDSPDVKRIRFHVYDVVTDQPFSKRIEFISSLPTNPYLEKVETLLCEKDMFRVHFQRYIELQYEGIMLRTKEGMYQKGYRSQSLQKYKEFQEAEFTIIGFEDGEGRDKGCVIWICEKEGKEFRVRPRGTMEQRKEWFVHGSSYVGKELTVIFQECSEQGIPRFPVGKAIRDGY